MYTMQVYQAIGIIIGSAIILLFLFYSVTRYYNYRLQKSLQYQNEVYSMIDGIHPDKEQLDNQLYENITVSKVQEWENVSKKQGVELFQINQRSQLKQSLYEPADSIYSQSGVNNMLKFKSIPMVPQTENTARSLKNLHIQKLSHNHPNKNNSFTHNSYNNNNNNQYSKNISYNTSQQLNKNFPTQTFTHISKISSYTKKGIEIVQIFISSVYKDKKGQLKPKDKKKINKQLVQPQDDQFVQCMEVFGYEIQYSAYKYQSVVKIPKISINQQYSIQNVKSIVNKQQISLSQYQRILQEIQQEAYN